MKLLEHLQGTGVVTAPDVTATHAIDSDVPMRDVGRTQAGACDSLSGCRSHQRYPIGLGILCKALPSDGVVLGKIRDISSGGVRFVSSEMLALGTTVELSIDWPGASRLGLKGQGRVLRSDEHGTAIEFERYEFCTRKSLTAAIHGAAAEQ